MTTLTWDRHRGHATGYDVVEFGFNYRLDELRAALGLVQLSRLDELNAARARLASRYRENLAGSCIHRAHAGRPRHVGPPPRRRARAIARRARAGTRAAPRSSGSRRASTTRRSTASAGTAARVRRLPVAEEIADRVVTLPLHPKLTESDVDEVCAALLED